MDLTPLLTGALGSVPALGAAWFAYRSASSANKVDHRKVDNDAFEKSQAAYERLLDRMQQQVDRMQSALDRVNTQLASEQDVSNVLRNQVRNLTAQVTELESIIASMRGKSGRTS